MNSACSVSLCECMVQMHGFKHDAHDVYHKMTTTELLYC